MPHPSPPAPGLPGPLERLVRGDSSDWSLRRLWQRMPPADKREAMQTVLSAAEEDDPYADLLLQALAGAAAFRSDTLRSRPPAEVARLAPHLSGRGLPDPGEFFRRYMLAGHGALVSAYLDAAGIAHEDGAIEPAFPGHVAPERAAAAAEGLLHRFDPAHVARYLVALHLTSPDFAPGIDEWLQEWASGPESSPGPRGEEPDPGEGDPDLPEPEIVLEARSETRAEAELPRSPFTVLDRTLIRAAVDGAQEVEGAPSRAEMEDMVRELLALNSTRHRSFFHRGFVDAIWGEPWRRSLPAENEDRRDWYVAGWVSGLARARRLDDVLRLHDEHPRVQEMMAPENEAAHLAAPILFDALCRAGRQPEAVRLVPASYLARNPLLLPRLLAEGTRLLREDEAEKARPIFDRLGEVLQGMRQRGEPTGERFFLEVRRRRAHCYRQLRAPDRARELLEGLLEDEPEPEIRAMVLADMGLLDGGFRSLAEVRLWRSDVELGDIEEALSRGESRFHEAFRTPSRPTGHGAWPLGVLAMARKEWVEARDLLGFALSAFLARPDRYGSHGLLARVKVATGIAEAMSMDYGRMVRAQDLLLQGLEEGGEVPAPLVPDLVSALELYEGDLVSPVLDRLVEGRGERVLDLLAGTSAAHRSGTVVRALLDRADRPDRKKAAEAADLRAALDVVLAESFADTEFASAEAPAILDRLEELARAEGVGREEFLALLASPEELDPVWSVEDARWARVAILEAEDRLHEALGVLRAEFHEIMAGNRGGFPGEEAEALLSRLRGYDMDEAWSDLRDRLAAWQRENEEPEEAFPETHPQQVPRVLIVGGDERQHGLRERVSHALEREGVRIRVEHLETGWSGNWSRTLDEALARSRAVDALVILRYVRTEFGRALRAGIERPWVSCPGVGTSQVSRMVKKAARWGLRARGGGGAAGR